MPVDISDGVVEDLGSALLAQVDAATPDFISWDCNIAGLKFLFGFSRSYPLQRETAPFRRERVDNERNPGEQSLDSGYWIRSQSSWHFGSGLLTAEPLEVSAEEAQFRYNRGGGVNPWQAGVLSLLKDTSNVYSSAGASQLMLGVGTGVLHATGNVLKHIANDNTATTITWGSTEDIQSITTDGLSWFLTTTVGLYKGALPSGAGAKIYDAKAGTARSLVRWVKSRLIYVCDNEVHEVTDLSPASVVHPPVFYTHPSTDWVWNDVSEGPTSIYLSGYANDVSSIYRVAIATTSTTVTLEQPVVVAEMPRGELANSLYSYLGTFLIVGTSKGARVAAMDVNGSLNLGPLTVESVDGCTDAVAVGSFVFVTVGSQSSSGDRVNRAGLWRINLGQTINNTQLLFASAADLTTNTTVTGKATQVTFAGGKLWFSVDTQGVYKESATFVPAGWVETGRIRLGTLESKAWRDLRLLAESESAGSVTAYANAAGSTAPSTWDQVISVNGTVTDSVGQLNVVAPGPVANLFVAFELESNDDRSLSAEMIGFQVRAIPAPRRAELLSVPLMCFDFETDRKGQAYGSVGLSWDRFSVLKQLESTSATIRWTDYTTGEVAEGYVEKVSMNRITPPSKGLKGENIGGLVTVLLRLS